MVEAGLKLLVIDDNPHDRLAIRRHVRALRATLLEAADGREGLRIIESEPLDLVLLDLELGDLSGGEVLATIRSGPARDLPVIVLTGSTDGGEKLILEGADDFVSKQELTASLLTQLVANSRLKATLRNEQRRHAEELHATNQALRERVRFERQFTGIVSHDLRTPLQAFRLGLAILEASELPERCQRTVEKMGRSAEHMSQMVGQLLDVTRISRDGVYPLNREPGVDALSIVRARVQEAELAGDGPAVELHEQGPVFGDFDPVGIGQICSNLLANALKHGDCSCPVVVRVHAVEGLLLLSVKNAAADGLPDDLQELFSPFFRGRTRAAGLGLGLYIAQQIAVAHGGTIRGYHHEGTVEFVLRVPLQRGGVDAVRRLS